MVELTRAQVLGYRVAVQQVESPADEEGVLLAGVQDVPPGRTAAVALRVRGLRVDPGRLALVQSVRGAPHVHRDTDLGLFAAAMRGLEAADLAKEQFGGFDQDLGWALGHVAEAMRRVCADGVPRTKGELSTELNDVVDARLRPWCAGCGVHHVQDALFRYATLQAGLVMDVRADGFHYVARTLQPADPKESMAALVRRLLRLCGPCRPEDLARWLALSPKAARRLWHDQLVQVTVGGRRGWVHEDDLGELRKAEPATQVRLLPPYDPITELADRELLLPERDRRAAVWRASANPGVLLVRGEIAGIWRQRKLTITVQPFGSVTAADRRAAERCAEQLTDAGAPHLVW